MNDLIARVLAEQVEYTRHTSSIGEVFDVCAVPTRGDGALEIVMFQPNSTYRPHVHRKSDAQVMILSGQGLVLPDRTPYSPGGIFTFPMGVPHGFQTGETPLVMLSLNEPGIVDPVTGDIDVHYL